MNKKFGYINQILDGKNVELSNCENQTDMQIFTPFTYLCI